VGSSQQAAYANFCEGLPYGDPVIDSQILETIVSTIY